MWNGCDELADNALNTNTSDTCSNRLNFLFEIIKLKITLLYTEENILSIDNIDSS